MSKLITGHMVQDYLKECISKERSELEALEECDYISGALDTLDIIESVVDQAVEMLEDLMQ